MKALLIAPLLAACVSDPIPEHIREARKIAAFNCVINEQSRFPKTWRVVAVYSDGQGGYWSVEQWCADKAKELVK